MRDLVKNPPEGVRLVLDGETGMPGSLSEVLVRCRICLFIVVYLFIVGVWILKNGIVN